MSNILIISYDRFSEPETSNKIAKVINQSIYGKKVYDYIFQLYFEREENLITKSNFIKTDKKDKYCKCNSYFLERIYYYHDKKSFEKHKQLAIDDLKNTINSSGYDVAYIQQTRNEYYDIIKQYLNDDKKIVYPFDALTQIPQGE